MNSYLRPAVSLIALMTVLTGVAYPLAITGVAQLAFNDQANGSLIHDNQGHLRGSSLIAQPFDGAQWFQSRPSAGSFATVSSGASNLAPSNPALRERIAGDSEKLAVAGQGAVPMALVTTSGSGLDPDLPVAAAQYQISRIAAARNIDGAALQRLIEQNTQRPLIGPEVVNVLALNLALAEQPQ
ncbi:potassium-transporting ATPase subunit KdpC [Pseudomonas turukhanskensis]|uniref:Potassium-transporting ATPase KdpC subunit n=1 Tax=Pseudomonas turukhanskensis TaxID=1806536 RepID=A0A9W6KAA5_9PSED|nr:potassium-transporting ATPase subunit KdpC [Pseudomonas turukhanskensis]GLK90575.1 potassium-transporting ATPase KdpC subunit [Pseudomonas turukhanskensis]